MFKKVLAAIICVAVSVTMFSCAPSKKKIFEKAAKEYFAQFEEFQSAGKIKKKVEFSKKGSVAYCYPKTGADELDSQINQFCLSLAEGFLTGDKTSEDYMLISYKSYKPVKNVYGVEMHCRTFVGGSATDTMQTFNYIKDGEAMTDTLNTMLAIEAREKDKTVDKNKRKSFVYKNDCIGVTFGCESGDVSVDVPYTKVRHLIADSIAESLEESNERTVDITKKMVALTFDDGPHNTYTNEILDTLEKYNAVATFFEVGNLVGQGADAIKRAEKLGCEIASHTWSHGNLQTLSLDGIQKQISRADEALEAVTGKKPKLLRPPYGAVGKTLLGSTDKLLIGWSVDTNDWKYRDKDKILSVIKNEESLDGDVVLMHSLYESTADAVKEMVPWLIENGYQLVTVSELVKYKYEDALEAGKYYAYNYFDYE